MDRIRHSDPRCYRARVPPASLPAAELGYDYYRNHDRLRALLTNLGGGKSRPLVYLERHGTAWTGSRHRRALPGYPPSELHGRLVGVRRKLRAVTIIRGGACGIDVATLGLLETHPA